MNDRKQNLEHGTEISSGKPIRFSEPKTSVFGPLLFQYVTKICSNSNAVIFLMTSQHIIDVGCNSNYEEIA